MRALAILLFLIPLLFTSASAQLFGTTIEMGNGTETTCDAIFYDSGGSLPNIGLFACITQGTYSNNENYTQTICSGTSQSVSIIFDELDIVSPNDHLFVYDGPDALSIEVGDLTQGSPTQQFVSSGTCLTFVFTSGDNGTSGVTGCDDGGDWVASVNCTDVYYIDDPTQENTCAGILVDNGGISGFYTEGATEVKTFCPGTLGNCVKLYFTMLDLGTGDVINIYDGTVAGGTPIYTLNSGDPVPPLGVSSESGNCLTIEFITNSDGNDGAGFQANVYCPPSCGTPPQCQGNDAADNQCTNATPICNLNGFCGNTSGTYDPVNHEGDNWNNVDGLMDDFCGSVENNSWLSFIADDETATLNVWTSNCANNQGIQMQVYSTTDCLDFIPHSNCVSEGTPTDFMISAFDLVVGETYYLMIDGFAGDNCDFIISAASGISVGGQITDEQTICPGNYANVAVEGLDTTTTTYSWTSVPAGEVPPSQANDPLISVSPGDTTVFICDVSGPAPNPTCPPVSETFQTTVNVLDAAHPACSPDIECWMSASGSTALACVGESVTLEAYGDITTSLLANDFNDGTPGVNWQSTTSATFTNPCGTGPDATYLWMGNNSPAIRQLTSATFNVENGGYIRFYLRYSVQGAGTPCEGPDEPDEGIQLQYNNFITASGWQILTGTQPGQLGYFNPSNGLQEATYNTANTPSAAGATNFTNWAQYTFDIPPAAMSQSTAFRWIQTASTTLDNDHWGLDSIMIVTPPADVSIDWTSIPPGYNETGAFPPDVSPQVSTCYIATVSATIDGAPISCSDTVCVDVFEPIANFDINDSEQCYIGNSFTFTNTGATGPVYNYTYDIPGVGSANTENATFTDIPVGTYNVTQTVDYNGVCSDDTTFTITVFNHPQISFTAALESCADSCDGQVSANISGNSPFSWLWNTTDTISTLTGLCAGMYNVVVTDDNNCTATDSYVLDPRVPVVISSTSYTATYCYGSCEGTATVNASGGVENFSYQWDAAANYQSGATANGLCAGNYSVTATDANQCWIDTNVTVTQPDSVTISTNAPSLICSGQSAIISAIPSGGNGSPYTIIWTVFPVDTISFSQSQSVSPAVSTCYRVDATDALFCKSPMDTVCVDVLPKLYLNMYSNDTLICPDSIATINVDFGGGNGGPYMLSHVFSIDDSLVTPPFIFDPSETDTAVVFALKDGCSSTVTDTIFIETLDPPIVKPTAYPYKGCQPITVYFNADVTYPPGESLLSYMWDFGDGSENNIAIYQNPEHEYENWGIFNYVLTVTTEHGCVSRHEGEEPIDVWRMPKALFYANDEEATIVWPVISFENHSSNLSDDFTWDFGYFVDGSPVGSSLAYPPPHEFPGYDDVTDSHEYLVTLTAVNPDQGDGSCFDVYESPIEIHNLHTFYAPTAFTPDGQIVENRVFKVTGWGFDKEHFHLLIFDRWGEKVFESFNFDHVWDGTIKGKEMAPVGVYSWMVVYRDFQQNQHQESGSVTVIR